LKRIERTGFGEFLFFDWRYLPDGKTSNPEFELNKSEFANAEILVALRNFGSGSSREHAPWALEQYGFRCIIAPSYADIFYNNCFQNGILPIIVDEAVAEDLIVKIRQNPGFKLTVDLPNQTISGDGIETVSFDIDEFRKHRLLNGLDDIGMAMQHTADIDAFEAKRATWTSRVFERDNSSEKLTTV
jgi:3-isopropylmalate/(R)-2-methylmalate dehydratase small subunit